MQKCFLYKRRIESISEAAFAQALKASLAAESVTDWRWPSDTNGRFNSMTKEWNIDLSHFRLASKSRTGRVLLTVETVYEGALESYQTHLTDTKDKRAENHAIASDSYIEKMTLGKAPLGSSRSYSQSRDYKECDLQ